MRQFKNVVGSGIVLASVLVGAGGGCTGITPDSTLQELLDASGLGGVTVGDVAGAIESFAGTAGFLPFGASLTEAQQAELTALRDQLDAGEITREDFHVKASEILGIEEVGGPFAAGPGRAFGRGGFPGGPRGFGGHGHGNLADRLADALGLTDEQVTLAQDIFDSLRADVNALQDDARTRIEALLTEDQLAILDGLPFGRHDGLRFFEHGLDEGRLSEKLGLTDDQRTQIDAVLETLRADVDSRRQVARDAFRAILTAEQVAELDAIKAERGDDAK